MVRLAIYSLGNIKPNFSWYGVTRLSDFGYFSHAVGGASSTKKGGNLSSVTQHQQPWGSRSIGSISSQVHSRIRSSSDNPIKRSDGRQRNPIWRRTGGHWSVQRCPVSPPPSVRAQSLCLTTVWVLATASPRPLPPRSTCHSWPWRHIGSRPSRLL